MAKYELKTKKNKASVVEFLKSVKDIQKRQDCLRLLEIFEEITGEKAQMWGESIVGFGSYHYRYASGQEGDWMLTGFSPRVQNITLYMMSGFAKDEHTNYDVAALLKKLGKYKTAKSCLYIKHLTDVDISVLKELIKKSTNHMKSLNK